MCSNKNAINHTTYIANIKIPIRAKKAIQGLIHCDEEGYELDGLFLKGGLPNFIYAEIRYSGLINL